MEADMQATFDNCNNFNTKLQDTLKGLINANNDRKSEIDSLRSDHEELKKVLHINLNIRWHKELYANFSNLITLMLPSIYQISFQAHQDFEKSATRENDLRKNEILSLEEKTQKENQVR